MQLSQILNFDTPYEHLKDGDLVHAGNVMIDKDTQTIQNEPGLKDFYFLIIVKFIVLTLTVVILNLLIFVGIGAADKYLELILIMSIMNL